MEKILTHFLRIISYSKVFVRSELCTYFIESLFFTNILIFSYYFLLQFLNSNFFPLRDTSHYLANRFNPEPFENPLYIILSVTLAILIFTYFSYRDKLFKFQTRIKGKILLYKSVFLLVLISLFSSRLSDYPMRDQVAPLSGNFILYILALMIIILMFRFNKSISKFLKKERLLYLAILVIISMLTFAPRFPIGANDYSAFFGPMIETSSGKTIYTEFNSQYGFLSVIFFGLLHKYGFNLMYMPIVAWGLYILEYFLSFYIIYKITKSSLFALLGLFSILTINYYSLIHLPSLIPQNIFRYPQILVAIALLFYFKNSKSKIFIFLISFLSFWTVDAGIALILGYSLTLFFLFLRKQIKFREWIATMIYFFINIVLVYLFINIILLILRYKSIDTSLIFEQIRNHGQLGFNMVLMPAKNFFWVFVLIYFLSIIYFVKDVSSNLSGKMVLFIANIALFINIYYVGRSIDHNLFHISIFSILNLFLLLGLFLKKDLNKNIVLIPIFIFLVFIPAFNRQYAVSGIIDKNLKNFALGNIFEPEINEKYLSNFYKDELSLVRKNIPEKDLIILSQDDTYLFYLLKKKNLLNGSPQGEYFLREDVKKAIKNTEKICPTRIITSCSLFNKSCSENLLYFGYYEPSSMQAILLNELENRCKFKYEPRQCTGRLCLAEKQ